MAMLNRYLVLSPFPPSLRDPTRPPTPHSARVSACAARDVTPPPWLRPPSDRPLIYVTLGTVFNAESGDLFARLLEGVRDLPVDVIATVGPQLDPAELGPQSGAVGCLPVCLDQGALLSSLSVAI